MVIVVGDLRLRNFKFVDWQWQNDVYVIVKTIAKKLAAASRATTRNRSSSDAANKEDMMQHHVLEVGDSEESLRFQRINKMITEGVEI
jgi:hypothetical protein